MLIMLLTTILLFVGVSLLAHIIPTAHDCVVFLSRTQRLLGFSKLAAEGDPTQSRTVRRRLKREQKRIAKAKQHRASSFPIARRGSGQEEAFPVFLSMPYFLGATNNEEACHLCTGDGEGSLEADRPGKPPNSCGSIAKHSLQRHVSAQPDCILAYFYYLLLLLMAKLGDVWDTVVDIFYWTRNWLAPTCCPAGPVHQQPSGKAKEKRKGKGKERPTKKRKRSGKNNKNNDGSGESDEETHKDHDNQPHHDGEEECPSGRFFACPFYKLDPVRHYRCLEKYKLKRYSDVKQHILRCHVLEGFYYCDQCLTIWESSEPWEAHVNGDECRGTTGPQHHLAESPLLDGLLPGEADCLEPTPRGLSDWQRWYRMWEQIFPGHEPPASPLVEHGIAEPARLFAHRGMAALLLMLPALLPLYDIQLDEGTTTSFASDIAGIYTNAMSAAPQSFRRRVPPTTVGRPLALQGIQPPNIGHQAIPTVRNPQDHLVEAAVDEAAILGGLQVPQEARQNYPPPPPPHSDPIFAVQALLDHADPAFPESDDIDFPEDQPDTV
ncbi:hypothetical protein EDB81DRAFT_807669 [Dactylonectria macrodidyma]|uniref:Uncharacterized protein n=1 Tax=Dactylonectria macrodidyma TaxID=307937 RepID=A0A9P9IQ32_9HYPO|nr:hypothetical protein EDB81DRAFT_807669 [Dactylonectria macrodidyma]